MGWGQEQEHPRGSSGRTAYLSGRWDVWEQGQGHHCGSSGCTASLRGGWSRGWFPALCRGCALGNTLSSQDSMQAEEHCSHGMCLHIPSHICLAGGL